jgi:hypothetical protein
MILTRLGLCLCMTALTLSGFVVACGNLSANDSGFERASGTGNNAADGGAASATPGAASDFGNEPSDNAVILVHAAKSQSFRLCFENEIDRRPQPDSETMPEANVVGVEVGSAVRLAPLRGVPGRVFLFEEPLIRPYYPTFGGAGAGPSCKNLLENASLSQLAVDLGRVDANLAQGVHLLVVRGCPADAALRKYSLAECGDGWTAATGNLTVKEIGLRGANRSGSPALPAQVVNLSQPLEAARAGRDLVVSFGDLASADGTRTVVATNPALFGAATPDEPARLTYASDDTAIYDAVGFRVQLAAPGGDAGATTMLDESLARIQRSSAPRAVPPTYYAAASNYALLLLGDPNAKLADGGPDDDERRNLHFLAVPVIDPKSGTDVDGGADAATGSDAGAP